MVYDLDFAERAAAERLAHLEVRPRDRSAVLQHPLPVRELARQAVLDLLKMIAEGILVELEAEQFGHRRGRHLAWRGGAEDARSPKVVRHGKIAQLVVVCQPLLPSLSALPGLGALAKAAAEPACEAADRRGLALEASRRRRIAPRARRAFDDEVQGRRPCRALEHHVGARGEPLGCAPVEESVDLLETKLAEGVHRVNHLAQEPAVGFTQQRARKALELLHLAADLEQRRTAAGAAHCPSLSTRAARHARTAAAAGLHRCDRRLGVGADVEGGVAAVARGDAGRRVEG